MDIDMHYYGTYALARAAGLSASVARRIATAAEFVDDSTDTEVIVHPDGARFRGESTAHHPADLAPINDRDDQLLVWVPFHFLPGAEGDTQSKKLVCRKNSQLAKEMIQHHLEWCEKPYAVELMGITAHVYADTFAHYGFSGVSSRVNRVKSDSFKLENGDPLAGAFDRFIGKFGTQGGLLKNFRAMLASKIGADASGALGHGAVATFPDQPYLEWSYRYEMPTASGTDLTVERQNANDFVEGAAALHAMFREFAQRVVLFADGTGGLDFDTLRPIVQAIVAKCVARDGRIAEWKKAIGEGKFSREGAETIADYDHTEWRRQTVLLGQLARPELASGVPVYHFHHAAAMHRNYVLRELLPNYGIYVI
jgi:hypothetical protein